MTTEKSIERQAMFFEFYVRRIWPIHRLFVKKYYSKRCVRCGIAEEYSPRNADKICTLCTEYEKRASTSPTDTAALQAALEKYLRSFESKGKQQYDALVLFSGGKDSSYLLYRLKETHPQLRLLALTVDNSFMSAVAMDNAVRVAKKLGVDHMTYAPKPRVYQNMFRYAFMHLQGLGSSPTIDMLDGEFLIDQGRIVAATMHIPLLVIGYSHEQVAIEHLETPTLYEGREKRTGSSVYTIEELTIEEDRHYWWDGGRFAAKDIPKVVFPFYAWNLSEEYIKAEVGRLGLIDGHKNSPLITNNTLIPLQGLVDVATLGYSSWEPEFTQMVREGKADKKFWQSTFELAQYSARTGKLMDKAIFTSLKQLNLTPKDIAGLEELMKRW